MLENYAFEIILTASITLLLLILRFILVALVKKFANKSEKVEQRTGLIIKYINYTFIFAVILSLILIWGVDFSSVGVVISSVFAIIGIGFFAQWSILSNITSGVIMFFSFPYKVGDKIKIHDKDFPIEGIIEDIRAKTGNVIGV